MLANAPTPASQTIKVSLPTLQFCSARVPKEISMDKYNQQNTPPKSADPNKKPAVGAPLPGCNTPTQTTGHPNPASDAAPRDPAKPAASHEAPPREGYTPPKA